MTTQINYDEHPIDRIYVEWANTLDSAGKDSGPARERALDDETLAALAFNMEQVSEVGDMTDMLKKWIFYGKTVPLGLKALMIQDGAAVHAYKALQDHNTMRILHAALGKAGEAAEIMTMLRNHIFEGQPLDMENLIEECGDSLWYLALDARACGFATFDEFMMSNKAKLMARYKTGRWLQEDAINRDTKTEMTELAKSLGLDEESDHVTLDLNDNYEPADNRDSYPIPEGYAMLRRTDTVQAGDRYWIGEGIWNEVDAGSNLVGTLADTPIPVIRPMPLHGFSETVINPTEGELDAILKKYPNLTAIVSQLAFNQYESHAFGKSIEDNEAFKALRHYAYKEWQAQYQGVMKSQPDPDDNDDQQTRLG